MAHYGQGNSGPARQAWRLGDRVSDVEYGKRIYGRIVSPPRDPDASETEYVWVRWEDGQAGYYNPDNLDRGRGK